MTNTQFESEEGRRAELRSLLEQGIEIYDGYDDKELAGCLYTVLTADLTADDRFECAQIASEILAKVGMSADPVHEAVLMLA
jgi:hypothetical protein